MRKDCLSANINLNQFGSRYVLFAAGAHSWNPAHSFSLNLFGTLPRLFDLIATVLLNFYGPIKMNSDSEASLHTSQQPRNICLFLALFLAYFFL